MFQAFRAAFSPMAVLFLCICIGYILSKTKVVPANTSTALSKMENYVFGPALTLATMLRNCTVETFATHGNLVLYGLGCLLVAVGIALVLSRFFAPKGYTRNLYKYALAFGNFGFMGNALALSLFGDAGLYKYMLFTMPLSVGVYTWGIANLVPAGEQKKGAWVRQVFNVPSIACYSGILLGITGIARYIPSFITTAASNLGACMGPVAMVITGLVIADYDILQLLKNIRVYFASVLRLLVLPVLFLGAMLLLGAEDFALQAALVAFAAPLGLNTVVFPAAYGGDTSTGASMALISNVLAVATIPLLYASLMQFIG